jgi:hypothetical protein
MASYALLQTHNDLDAMIRIFNEVILTTPSSGDAQAMHSTIIAMVSSRLEKCFRTLQRREPNRTTLELIHTAHHTATVTVGFDLVVTAKSTWLHTPPDLCIAQDAGCDENTARSRR